MRVIKPMDRGSPQLITESDWAESIRGRKLRPSRRASLSLRRGCVGPIFVISKPPFEDASKAECTPIVSSSATLPRSRDEQATPSPQDWSSNLQRRWSSGLCREQKRMFFLVPCFQNSGFRVSETWFPMVTKAPGNGCLKPLAGSNGFSVPLLRKSADKSIRGFILKGPNYGSPQPASITQLLQPKNGSTEGDFRPAGSGSSGSAFCTCFSGQSMAQSKQGLRTPHDARRLSVGRDAAPFRDLSD